MLKSFQIGTVEIKVEDIRDVKDINYCLVRFEDEEKQTKIIHPKEVSDQKWGEHFTFPVHGQQADVEVVAVRKRSLRKDKQIGHTKISIASLQSQEEQHNWFPLTAVLSQKKLQKNLTKEIPTVGEVRLSVRFISSKPKKERIVKGIIREGEWTKATSGGTLMNHGTWMHNPQFLLKVKKTSEVNIKLFQPEGVDERISFYVIRYQAKIWGGRPKVVVQDSDKEIVKIDGFWAALFQEEAEGTVSLEKGKYVIMPCSENPGYAGKFSLNVWINQEEKEEPTLTLDLLSSQAEKDWKVQILEGEWTKKTAGGGNIAGLSWRRNPQFVITTDSEVTVCIILAQQEKDHSIGFYVIEYPGHGKKVVDYNNEVAKTESFKYLPSVGISNLKLRGLSKYLIIPCTHQPAIGAKFWLSIYSDKKIDFHELTESWEHSVSKRSKWEGEKAGGSPNNTDSFTNNPQFVLSFPEGQRTEFIVNLTVPDPYDAVGFLVFKKTPPAERITKGNLLNDDIYCKPQGWESRMSVSVETSITEKVASSFSFIIIPSTFKPGITKEFEITVYSDHQLELNELNPSTYESEGSSDEEKNKSSD